MDKLLIGRSRPVDQSVLPNGIYRFWRKSFMLQGKIVTNLVQIKSDDDVTLLKGFEENLLLKQENPLGPALSTARLFRAGAAACGWRVDLLPGPSGQANINFFEFGLEGNMRFYPGFALLVRRRMDGMNRLTAAVLERLPHDPGLWRSIVRQETVHDMDYAPPIVQRALQRMPDGL